MKHIGMFASVLVIFLILMIIPQFSFAEQSPQALQVGVGEVDTQAQEGLSRLIVNVELFMHFA